MGEEHVQFFQGSPSTIEQTGDKLYTYFFCNKKCVDVTLYIDSQIIKLDIEILICHLCDIYLCVQINILTLHYLLLVLHTGIYTDSMPFPKHTHLGIQRRILGVALCKVCLG